MAHLRVVEYSTLLGHSTVAPCAADLLRLRRHLAVFVFRGLCVFSFANTNGLICLLLDVPAIRVQHATSLDATFRAVLSLIQYNVPGTVHELPDED